MFALKASKLRQACRPRENLTQAVKQPYNVCCLIGHLFKGVGQCEQHEDNVHLPKILSRFLSWCQNRHIPKRHYYRLCAAKPANKGELGASAKEHAKV